jgi:uncharacterized protein YjbJ (UPF0337 family)
MNQPQLEGLWKLLKGKVMKQWGELIYNDNYVMEGKRLQLVGKIYIAYGYKKARSNKQRSML